MGIVDTRQNGHPYRMRLTKDIIPQTITKWSLDKSPMYFLLIGIMLAETGYAVYYYISDNMLAFSISCAVAAICLFIWAGFVVNRTKTAAIPASIPIENHEPKKKEVEISIEKSTYYDKTIRFMATCKDENDSLLVEFGTTEQEAVDKVKRKLAKIDKYIVKVEV